MNQTIEHDEHEPMREDRRIAKIEDALDKQRAGAVPISGAAGGLTFNSMIEVMEFSKLMAVADAAVPPHLRGNPGACLAVCVQSVEWRMSPFQVANKSYFVNGRMAFESQLIHAIIEARAPLERRLRVSYTGEGQERRCIVTGIFRGEDVEHTYTSPRLVDIKPQNSPLWKSDPDQQLWYYSSRAWARRWCPDVILGIYTPDEIPEREYPEMDRKPSVVDRLAEKQIEGEPVVHAEGFKADHVDRQVPPKTGAADIETKVREKDKAERDAGVAEKEAEAIRQAHAAEEAERKMLEDEARQTADPRGSVKTDPEAPKEPPAENNAQAPAPGKTPAAQKGGKPAAPETEEGYIAHFREWLPTAKDATAAHDRWMKERKLRQACKVSAQTLEMLQEEIERHEFG